MIQGKQVGLKVESIRNLKNMSRSELSERTGISEEMLELIEGGSELPSLAPLIRIARCLGVRLGTFLDDSEIPGPVVSRKGELKKGVGFSGKSAGSNVYLNFHPLAGDKSGRHMEPFIVQINPSDSDDHALSSHEGEEFLYVLEGEIEISYGKESFLLSQGDSIYFDSVIKHNIHCLKQKSATVLAVVYAPF